MATIAFWVFGKSLLSLSPVWQAYTDYADLLPVLTATTGAAVAIGAIVTYEMACRRFGAATLVLLSNVIWTVLLVGFSGMDFFRGILPDAAVDYVVSLHVNRLSVFTWASLVSAILQLALLGCIYRLTRSSRTCAATMS